MLSRVDILLQPEKDDLRIAKSSLFHGWLMNLVTSDVAEELHRNQLRPYSQYVYHAEDGWHWRVQTLSKEYREKILTPLMETIPSEMVLEHSGSAFHLTDYSYEELSYQDLFERNYIEQVHQGPIKLCMLTPMSFKSNGQYVRFPEPHYLFGHLITRFDAFSHTMLLGDEKLQEVLDQKISVGNYRISSSAFPLEGIRIPAFRGEITYCPRGGKQMNSLIQMLVDFAEYSGIGIKTALGMGAVKRIERERQEKSCDKQ